MLAFDHLVIFSQNPELDQEHASIQHGLITTKGGHHEQWGTYNYLSFMENRCYIEWIGIEDEKKVQTSDNPLIQHVGYASGRGFYGPIQFALRTQHMDQFLDHYDTNHIPYHGPFPGQRKRPDGTVMKWRMLFPDYDLKYNILPFLIEWEDGENHPPQINIVNEVHFSHIQMGVKNIKEMAHRLQEIYMLKDARFIETEKGNWKAEWDLENGFLQLVKHEGLTAKFDDLTFR